MRVAMKESYCYVGDLLGFKNIILNLESDKQCRRVDSWIEFVDKGADKFGIQNYHLISDTIFAIANGPHGLETLLDFSKYMLEEGLKKSFPLRGGITFGEVNWRPHVVFGKAIIEAFDLANRQNWVGTSCDLDSSCMHGLWDMDRVILYIPPMKNGMAKFMPVSSWDMPSCNKVLSNMSIEGLSSKHDIGEWKKLDVIHNTQIFSLYLKMRKQFCDEFAIKTKEPEAAKFIRAHYANEARDPLEYIERSMNKLQSNGSILLGDKAEDDRYLKAYERYKENRLLEQQLEQASKANGNEQIRVHPAEIWVTPESGLFGKVIPIRIGDLVKIGLYGADWEPGGRSIPKNNIRPLNSKGVFIDEAEKRTVFVFIAQAIGKEELEFTSGDEQSRIVMGATIIVTE